MDTDSTTEIHAANEALATLRSDFEAPPADARPLVWWHWLDENVTAEGITADLEWFKRAGFAGFQWFDVSVGAPHVVEQPARFGSDLWLDLMGHTMAEAERLDLEMTVHAGGGWSQTGGPWVSPDQSMKKLVWSSQIVEGGQSQVLDLPPLPDTAGPFQDIPIEPQAGFPDMKGTIKSRNMPPVDDVDPIRFVRPAHIIARKLTDDELIFRSTIPTILIDDEPASTEPLTDGLYGDSVPVPLAEGRNHVHVQFDQEVFIDSVQIGVAGGWPSGTVDARLDGEWREVAVFPGPSHFKISIPVRTFGFDSIRASELRVTFDDGAEVPAIRRLLGQQPSDVVNVTEVRFGVDRIDRFESKAGFDIVYDYAELREGQSPVAPDGSLDDEVLDLSPYLSENGQLDWTPPDGRWEILQFGYSSTGMLNQTASPGGSGLEADKLNAEHVNAFVDGWFGLLDEASRRTASGAQVDGLLLNSWEAGTSNWTEGMREHFQELRGYDPLPFLPALAGYVVGDRAQSDQFLQDFRATLSDLLARENYETLQARTSERGMILYGEAMGARGWVLGNGIELKTISDIPMAEFWYSPPGQEAAVDNAYVTDIREASSARNVAGKSFVAAEAFTTSPVYPPWGQAPKDLKWIADRFAVEGVSRYIIHSSDHQPLDDARPGLTLWEIGQFLNRHDMWAEQAHGFTSYLSRVSALLQRGTHVADFLIFVGEEAPVTLPYWDPEEANLPPGYDYNYIDLSNLLDSKIDSGRTITPSGLSARALILPDRLEGLSSSARARLDELAVEGVSIVGKPVSSRLGLQNQRSAHRDATPFTPRFTSINDFLMTTGLLPDIELAKPIQEDVKWTHRYYEGLDIIFIVNLGEETLEFPIDIRTEASKAEWWDQERGRQEALEVSRTDSHLRTVISLNARQSGFIILHDDPFATDLKTVSIDDAIAVQTVELDGPWSLHLTGWKQEFKKNNVKLGYWDRSAEADI